MNLVSQSKSQDKELTITKTVSLLASHNNPVDLF
jgi:hypothetical protein